MPGRNRLQLRLIRFDLFDASSRNANRAGSPPRKLDHAGARAESGFQKGKVRIATTCNHRSEKESDGHGNWLEMRENKDGH